MTVILGIDAAWTDRQPSGVALVHQAGRRWSCIAVAPSYQSFIGLAEGRPINWALRPVGTEADPKKLLEAATELAGKTVDLVTVDMPIAIVPIEGRRVADNQVSRAYAKQKCCAHSPNNARPGQLGAAFSAAFAALSYAVGTTATAEQSYPRLLEVYPHPALLTLMNTHMRVPYKQSKSKTYWPTADRKKRVENLLLTYHEIAVKLHEALGPFDLQLPAEQCSGGIKLATLKRYEDALDALICCWVGTLYAQGQAIPLGDETAAIWCPKPT